MPASSPTFAPYYSGRANTSSMLPDWFLCFYFMAFGGLGTLSADSGDRLCQPEHRTRTKWQERSSSILARILQKVEVLYIQYIRILTTLLQTSPCLKCTDLSWYSFLGTSPREVPISPPSCRVSPSHLFLPMAFPCHCTKHTHIRVSLTSPRGIAL